jgi:hypothetical protein
MQSTNDYLENLYGCKFITINDNFDIVYDPLYKDIFEEKVNNDLNKLTDENIKQTNDYLENLYGCKFLVLERINGKIEYKFDLNNQEIFLKRFN